MRSYFNEVIIKYVDICKAYFVAFEGKNILSLEKKYHDQIKLVDWDVSVSGILNVLKINEEFFKSVDSISVTVKSQGVEYAKSSETVLVFNDIEVCINQSDEKLFIVDVIDIEINSGLIKSIRAYKR